MNMGLRKEITTFNRIQKIIIEKQDWKGARYSGHDNGKNPVIITGWLPIEKKLFFPLTKFYKNFSSKLLIPYCDVMRIIIVLSRKKS